MISVCVILYFVASLLVDFTSTVLNVNLVYRHLLPVCNTNYIVCRENWAINRMLYVAPEERRDLLPLKGNTDLSYDNLSLTTENMNWDMRFPTVWYE